MPRIHKFNQNGANVFEVTVNDEKLTVIVIGDTLSTPSDQGMHGVGTLFAPPPPTPPERDFVGFYGTDKLHAHTGVALWYGNDATSATLFAFQAGQQDEMQLPAQWPVPPDGWTWVACVPPRYAGTEGFINTGYTGCDSLDPVNAAWPSVVIPPKLINWQDYQDEQEGDGP